MQDEPIMFSATLMTEADGVVMPYEILNGIEYMKCGVICEHDDGYLCEERFNYIKEQLCKK